MSTIIIEKSELIKKSIKDTSEKSKETIREIIESNSKYIDSALDSNKQIVDSIKKKLEQRDIKDSVTDSLKQTFKKSVELTEDAIDSIINAYSNQVELNVDFNTKLIDVIKETKGQNPEKVLDFIYENFEVSRQLTIKNTKEILYYYNQQTNLAVNFNKKIEENINNQVEILADIQSKGLNKFTEWASDWWKENEKVIKY